MNPQRWEHIADEFEAAGLMDKKVDVDSFLFRTQTNNWKWLLNVLLVIAILIIVITLILAKFYRLNRHLQAKISSAAWRWKGTQERAIDRLRHRRAQPPWFPGTIGEEFDRTERNDTTLSLLELDLDYFNTSMTLTIGGDRALVFVASVCRGAVRSIDSVGRVGGEEFMILLPNATAKDAQMVAERILSILEDTPLRLADGQKITLTASIGVAELLDHEDIASLMRRVDQAMY
ncbi:MAG: GGDEF domain-containing protein [Gammaproteobacteria bacterium]|nr:GGDEF domain-containing protein [Gammaproteobacteria bacterium]